MATITQVAETIQKVFGEQIETLAKQSGFIKRRVTVTGIGDGVSSQAFSQL